MHRLFVFLMSLGVCIGLGSGTTGCSGDDDSSSDNSDSSQEDGGSIGGEGEDAGKGDDSDTTENVPTEWPGDLDIDCENLPKGPFTPELISDQIGPAEDLAFNGQGQFVTLNGDSLLFMDSDHVQTSVPLDETISDGGGLRYMLDGSLLITRVFQSKLSRISPDGAVTDWKARLSTPNALYPDFDGDVWVSESTGNQIVRFKADGKKQVVVSGGIANAPNGVVYDRRRRALFFAAGLGEEKLRLGRVDFDDNGEPFEPVELFSQDNASGDGIALDGCGNLYIVDTLSGNQVRRFFLDKKGDVVDQDVVARFDLPITNLQWASGPGFSPTEIYVVGMFSRSVQRVDVGVIGAPVPVPDFDDAP